MSVKFRPPRISSLQHPIDPIDRLVCYYALVAVAQFAIDDPDTTSARHAIVMLNEKIRQISRQLAERIMALCEARPEAVAPLRHARRRPPQKEK